MCSFGPTHLVPPNRNFLVVSLDFVKAFVVPRAAGLGSKNNYPKTLLGYDPRNVCGQGYLVDVVSCGEDGVEVMY